LPAIVIPVSLRNAPHTRSTRSGSVTFTNM
jgi:hypothetical protein